MTFSAFWRLANALDFHLLARDAPDNFLLTASLRDPVDAEPSFNAGENLCKSPSFGGRALRGMIVRESFSSVYAAFQWPTMYATQICTIRDRKSTPDALYGMLSKPFHSHPLPFG
jgi:hypothetical protein